MAQITGQNLPPPQSPFVDGSTFALSYFGYQFLLSLLAQAATSQATATVETGLAATGSNQATALQLNSQWNEIDTTPAGSGVLLSILNPGQTQTVFNQGLQTLNVYPPPGMQIDALGVNVPFSVASGAKHTFDFLSGSQIRS